MKKQLLFLLSLVVIGSLAWVGCSPDVEQQRLYYSSYGTVETTDNLNFTVLLDNGSMLIPDRTVEDIENDSRVLLGFYITSIDSSTSEHVIEAEIIELYKVYTRDVIQLTEALIDSVGNDGVDVAEEDVWLSTKHLNVRFGFYGGGILHAINLVKPIGEQMDDDGNQILEFRHNKNDDALTQYIVATTSFFMESLYEEGKDSINYAFRSYDYDSVLTEVKGTYHFKNHQPVLKPLNVGPINFDPEYSFRQIQ